MRLLSRLINRINHLQKPEQGLPPSSNLRTANLKPIYAQRRSGSIGWSRTTNVKRGDTCTQEQADAWLATEYDAFATAVLKALGKAKTSANQLDAMVSLAYNIGIGAYAKFTLLRKHIARDYAGAAKEFVRGNKVTG